MQAKRVPLAAKMVPADNKLSIIYYLLLPSQPLHTENRVSKYMRNLSGFLLNTNNSSCIF